VSRPGSRREHRKFCDTEGWSLVRNARGKAVRHHVGYELPLADGRVLRTRISRPANNERYGPALWAAVLGPAQLDVTEAEFWACGQDGVLPVRADRAVAPPRALPADLVHQLLHGVGLTEAEVAPLSLAEALERLNEWWSQPRE